MAGTAFHATNREGFMPDNFILYVLCHIYDQLQISIDTFKGFGHTLCDKYLGIETLTETFNTGRLLTSTNYDYLWVVYRLAMIVLRTYTFLCHPEWLLPQ